MSAQAVPMRLALLGNPNSGKTALFNQLTGSRQKVANYAGVTVERKEGRLHSPGGHTYAVLDLPGAYSLTPASLDEAITRDLCRGFYPGEAAPDVLVCVVDATNLRLHLRFVLEVRQMGKPMIVALNMSDAAQRRGIAIDRDALERELGVPVVETVAIRHHGARALVERIDQVAAHPHPPGVQLSADADLHAETRRLLAATVSMPTRTARIDDALDRWLLHPLFGLLTLAVVMFLIFQAVYAWATPVMDLIEAGTGALGEWVGARMGEGPLASLMVDGIIAGVGGVIVFLPQILVLFAFILALEESGYLPRAAFLLDRMMAGAGLSGRSFIPLLSSFACAIPGIMATRSIQDPRDRLATILVAPLMTCSARLPVYTLLIGAFIPARQVWGGFNLQGLLQVGSGGLGQHPGRRMWMGSQRVDALDQRLRTVLAHRHRLHHRHAEFALQYFAVDGDAALLRSVDHVQRHHHRPAHLPHFQHEAQVQAQVGGVDHAHQHVRRRLARVEATAQVAGDRFVQAGRVEAVGTRQVQHRVAAPGRRAQHALLALDRDPGIVGHLLPAAGELVEQRGLAAVRVAQQGQAQGHGGLAHAAVSCAARPSRTRAASERRRAKRV